MDSPEIAARLEDIVEAIAAIGAYTSGKSFDDYVAERMLRDAVERNIERISEASRHIPRNLKAKHPEIPWRKVAGSGSILRHAFRDLPPLKAAVEQILGEIDAGEADG
jgi:uncharacterized protein with HEPN domain